MAKNGSNWLEMGVFLAILRFIYQKARNIVQKFSVFIQKTLYLESKIFSIVQKYSALYKNFAP
jgi:hypothetical protein